MSDPEVPQNDQPDDIDHVVGSANEGLDAAAAARADAPAETDSAPAPDRTDAEPVDADMEAFAAAERDHPGTFGSSDATPADAAPVVATHSERTPDRASGVAAPAETTPGAAPIETADAHRDADTHIISSGTDTSDVARTHLTDAGSTHTVADDAYSTGAAAAATETQVVPAEPVAPPAAPQPIFVQAPEPPRELGNRGTAGAIGLVATVAFAILYLGAILGLGAWAGDVSVDNVGEAALKPLTTSSFWVPVAVFFLSFWLLGAFINRGRWGKWVIFGILVGVATYGGHILGQLFQAPFWRINATQSAELVNEQVLAPLAIAAFVFARELTIWFGAWVARSGARKKALNAEAQAEYERTLEAGPSVSVR